MGARRLTILTMRALSRGLGLARLPGASRLYALVYRAVQPSPDEEIAVNGLRMVVNPGDLGISRSLVVRGTYEEHIAQRFLECLATGATVVEVGAHIGYYTLLAARAVGAAGRVIAFEPDPANFRLLERNLRLNGFGNVEARQQAVADRPGTLTVFRDAVNSGRSSIAAGAVAVEQDTVEVETVTLDSLGLDRVDLLLVSAQGAESRIFAGGDELLGQTSHVILDFWANGLRAAGSDPAAFLQHIEGGGFAVEILDPPAGPAGADDVLARAAARRGDGVHLLLSSSVARTPVASR